MTTEVKILIVEPEPAQLELILLQLQQSDRIYKAQAVKTQKAYRKAIGNFCPDLILSDSNLPSFNSAAAFDIQQELCPTTPFIIISEMIDEEKAVALIKAGVTDYVLKESLLSLPVKMERALKGAREIAEQQITAAALQTALSDMKKIMDSSLDVICAVDEAGYFVQVSAACEAVWGYLPLEMIGRPILDFVYPEDHEKTNHGAEQVMSGTKLTHFENRYIHKNGSIVPMVWSASWNSKDRIRYGVARDATEKKRMERLFETERQRINELFMQAPSCMGILKGPTHVFELANPLCLQLIGKTNVIGKTVIDVVPETSPQGFIEILDGVYKTGETFSAYEMRLQLATVENETLRDIYLNFVCQAYQNSSGIIEGIFFFAIDVTEQVMSRQKIEESGRLYQALFEQNLAGIYQSALNGNIINCNSAFAKMLHYDAPEELTGVNMADLYFGDLAGNYFFEDLQAQKNLSYYEMVLNCKDGSLVNVLGNIRIHTDTHTGQEFCDGVLIDITERKKTDMELRWLIDNTEESFILLDRDLIIISCNRQAQLLYVAYFGKELIKGSCILNYVQPARLDAVKIIYKKVLAGFEEESEIIIPLQDSAHKTFSLKYKPAKDEEGHIIGVFVSVVDITEKKRTEQQLIIQEKRYRSLVENGADAVAVFSPAGAVTYISPTIKTVLGYSEEEIMKMDMFSLLHPEDATSVQSTWELVLKSAPGVPVKGQAGRMLHKNGSWRWIEATVTNMLHDPVLKGVVDNFRDVTEKIEADRLREFERRDKEALINSSTDLIWSVSSQFKVIAGNQAFFKSVEAFTGVTLHPGDNLLLPEKFPAGYIAFWEKLYMKALEGQSIKEEIHTPAWKQYPEQWHETSFHPIFDGSMITGIACYSRDITASKIARNQLTESEKRYSDLFHLSPQPMCLYEKDTFRFTKINNAAMVHFGYTEDELLQMTLLDIVPAEDRQKAIEMVADQKRTLNQTYQAKSRGLKKSGEIIALETFSTPILINDEESTLLIAIDVTEKNLHEYAVLKAIIKTQEDERYEIGGELHDNVCQILSSCLLCLGMMKKHLELPGIKWYNDCDKYVKRASDEIRNLSHRLAPAFLDGSTLENAFDELLASFNIEEKFRVVLEFDEAVSQDTISHELQLNLYRILQEQLKNILKYANASSIRVQVALHNNSIQMQITDNGDGFDISAVKSGIGISNMRRRVELFLGQFELQSSPGNGCVITINIPLPALN